MSPPRRSQSLFLGDLQWRPILMSAEHSFYTVEFVQMNKRLISLCANIVNQSSIQMDFDNTPMLSKLKVLLLAFTAIENFGSSTKRRFYKSFLMVSMSPPRRSQSLFLGDLQWRPILMSAEHSFYE